MGYNRPYRPTAKSIETNPHGFRELLNFCATTISKPNESFELDLSLLNNIDANLASFLAAIKYKLDKRNNKLFVRFAGATFGVFKRNGLISFNSGIVNDTTIQDDRESTIPLRLFMPTDDSKFTSYLKNDFFGHRGATEHTKTIKDQLTGHFTEVYQNVFMHANTTEPIFTCGQFYPKQKELKFTLVDLGDGFLRKIKEKTEGKITSEASAIQWALLGNSTRNIEKFGPGGGVLKAIHEYCRKHNGSLLIISGSEYCNAGSGPVESGKLPCPFKGSIVNLILRNL